MRLFTRKITRTIHDDLTRLLTELPLEARPYNEQAKRYGNNTFNLKQPPSDVHEYEYEWDEHEQNDVLVPDFIHYPTGVRVWLGRTAFTTTHTRVNPEQWAEIMKACQVYVDFEYRQ